MADRFLRIEKDLATVRKDIERNSKKPSASPDTLGPADYSVDFPINATTLGNCLYFNMRNLTSYSSGKTQARQKAVYELLHTFSPHSRAAMETETGLKLLVKVFPSKDAATPLTSSVCAVSRAKKQLTVNWSNEVKRALQQLFPISTALAIVHGKNADVSEDSPLYEALCIEPVPAEETDSGYWRLYPKKQAKNIVSNPNNTDPNNISLSAEYELMFAILQDYAKGLYLNTSKKRESSRAHDTAIEESTHWMDASEFQGKYRAWENCIYSLASEPDASGKRLVYVGEAVVAGNRLDTFHINGTTYIDHTKNEAIAHQFTRFRIDRLKAEARPYLHDTQDAIIGALRMLEQECSDGFTMSNIQLCTAISDALGTDKNNRKP